MGSKSIEARDWKNLIAEYERGNELQDDFCRRRRINIWTFRSRLYKTRRNGGSGKRPKNGQPVRFVEVKSQPGTLRSGSCRITVGAVTLELDNLPSPEWIAELVNSYGE